MNDSKKEDLLSGMDRNFTRFQLELDTLPPVLFNDRRIKAHVEEKLIDACDVVAHAIGWTETALKWIETLHGGELPALPTKNHQWDELERLSSDFYLKYNTQPFKELRARLLDGNTRLMKLLEESAEILLFEKPVEKEQTMGNLIHQYISSLYAGEVIRLRVWKKGLGWV